MILCKAKPPVGAMLCMKFDDEDGIWIRGVLAAYERTFVDPLGKERHRVAVNIVRDDSDGYWKETDSDELWVESWTIGGDVVYWLREEPEDAVPDSV